MKDTLQRSLGAVIAVALLIAAFWMLRHTLAAYNYHDILIYLKQLPLWQPALALGFTLLSYLIMTGYDLLAMRYIHRPLASVKIGFAAFISYAFSNSVGPSLLTSSSVRYRLYTHWGLKTIEIAQVVMFTGLTMWLGLLAIGGCLLAVRSLPSAALSYFPFINGHLLGLSMLLAPLSYLLFMGIRRQPLQLWRWTFSLVPLRLASLQIAIGALDWVMISTVLYILLPLSDPLDFATFFGIFLVAQTAGLLSHIPGGLGVFESLMLMMLSFYVPATDILGALLAYRLIYFLLPLGLAMLCLAIHEGRRFGFPINLQLQRGGE